MLKISEIFEFSTSNENSYFERIRTVRMVRMVRSLADRTFQFWCVPVRERVVPRLEVRIDLGLAGRLVEGDPRASERRVVELAQDEGVQHQLVRHDSKPILEPQQCNIF